MTCYKGAMFGWHKKKLVLEEADRLEADALSLSDGWLCGTSGIPCSVDSCAYEPVQKLLAVSTTDGRVKLFGKTGVERTLFSGCYHSHGTRQLEFLVNRGVLLRVSTGGFLESWSLGSSAPKGGSKKSIAAADAGVTDLCAIKIENDQITCVAIMRRDPFLLLGCASGNLRFAALVGPGGSLLGDMRPPTSMKLLPYRVTAEQLRGTGELTAVAVRSMGVTHVLLALHPQTGVAVWDMRAEELVTSLNPRAKDASQPALRKAGKITAVTWLHTPTLPPVADFATGHDTGDILIWRLPELDSESDQQLSVHCRLKVVPAGAEPICSLQPLLVGNTRRAALLVCGGQGDDAPDGLAMLSVPNGSSNESERRTTLEDDYDEEGSRSTPTGAATLVGGASLVRLPYQGAALAHCTLPSAGALQGYEDAAQVIQVLETAQLAVFEVDGKRLKKPALCPGPGIQTQGEVTCTAACTIPWQRPSGAAACSFAALPLRQALHMSVTSPRGSAGGANSSNVAGSWAGVLGKVITGGILAKPSAAHCTVYCTGYKNGFVHLWDVSGEQPTLLGSAPSLSAVNTKLDQSTLRAVTALEVVPEHGMVITGHLKGEIRVYQFSDKAKQLDVMTLGAAQKEDDSKPSKAARLTEEPGLQLKLRSLTHAAEILSMNYSPSNKALVACDKQGQVSVMDLSKPVLLWSATPLAQPCTCVNIVTIPAPAKKDRSSAVSDTMSENAPCPAVLLTGADTSATVVTLDAGLEIGKNGEVKPKNKSLALLCQPLDEHYHPTWMSSGNNQQQKGGTIKKKPNANASWQSKLHGGAAKLKAHNSDTDDSDDSDDTDEDNGEMKEGDGSSNIAHHLLLISDQYIRIYSMHGLVAGDRTTETKISTPHPLLWAATIHIQHAPGIICLATPADGGDPVFLVYSLPSLVLLCEQPIGQACAPALGQAGYPPVVWDAPQSAVKARRCVAATRKGNLLLLGSGNELLHCCISEVTPMPQPPAQVYDWEIAQAAHAASTAAEQAAMAAALAPQNPSRAAAARRPAAASQSSAQYSDGAEYEGDRTSNTSELSGGARRPAGLDFTRQLGDVFSKVTQDSPKPTSNNMMQQRYPTLTNEAVMPIQTGVTKVYEGTSKGLATVAKGVETGVKGVASNVGKLFVEEAPDPMTIYDRNHPELLAVLSKNMPEEASKTRGRGRAAADEDDGIPVTVPSALVMHGSAQGVGVIRNTAAASNTGVSRAGTEPGSRNNPRQPQSTRGAGAGASQQVEGDSDTETSQSPSPTISRQQQRQRDRDREADDDGAGLSTRQKEREGQRERERDRSAGAGAGASTRGFSGGSQPTSTRQENTTKGAAKPVEPESEDEESEEEEEEGNRVGQNAKQLADNMKAGLMTGAQAIAGTFNRIGTMAHEAATKAQASGSGSNKYKPDAPARDRTTAEIKAQYGRGREAGGARGVNSRTQDVRDVVLEARQKLHERGERFNRLDEKAGDMENEAEGFASLAKQLAEKQKNRKWWEL